MSIHRAPRSLAVIVLALCALAAAAVGIHVTPSLDIPSDSPNGEVQIVRADVPTNVMEAIRNAEQNSYDELSPGRRLIEEAQNTASQLVPAAAYHLNFSVGSHRVKPKTVHGLISYAEAQGLLKTPGPESLDPHELPRLSHHPSHDEWQVALILQNLKDRHPNLTSRSWKDIAADPNAIAKLYSGYAGGPDAAWCASAEPGPVAKQRLRFDPASGIYAEIPPAQHT